MSEKDCEKSGQSKTATIVEAVNFFADDYRKKSKIIEVRKMFPIEIAEKQYTGIYTEVKGCDIRQTSLFNKVFCANVQNESEETFVVYTDDLNINTDDDYVIYGYDAGCSYPFGLSKKVNFAHSVNLIDDEIYTQNSNSGCIKGKVIGIKVYKFNFDIIDVTEKKNTYINLMLKIGYDFDSLQIENIAVGTYNIRLLENLFRYRKRYYDDYSTREFQTFKETAVRNIKITNLHRQQLLEGIKKCLSFKELGEYIKKKQGWFYRQCRFTI